MSPFMTNVPVWVCVFGGIAVYLLAYAQGRADGLHAVKLVKCECCGTWVKPDVLAAHRKTSA